MDKIKLFVPATLLALFGFVIAFQFVDPAPPMTLTFSAGQKGGAYYAHAESYRDYLRQHGIRVEIFDSAGSMENIERLKSGAADVAFVQSGLVSTKTAKTGVLQSLGSMYYEPLWVFLRQGVKAQFLSELKGKRIAIGLPGSGTRVLALQLLSENGIDEKNSALLPLSSLDASKALIAAEIDAVMIVSAATSAAVQNLQQNTNVHLMPIKRAMAYTRRMDSISSVLLPQGALNLAANVPATDTPLLASAATLIVNESMHPALQALMMQAATDIHAGSSLFSTAGAFPTAQYAGLGLSTVAKNYYKSGPPLLQRYLPFWAATLVNRLKVMLLPFLVLLIPLFKVMPPLYRWRIRSGIYRWYEEIGKIDAEMMAGYSESLQLDLDRIEMEIRKVKVPLSYAEELYDLRLHLALVRDQLEQAKVGVPDKHRQRRNQS
ncbi:TAXI family TRAP transporter solute-binding subunit [Mariprofundus sp. EBB-1]|uniref:TAXI family TRAP transporter solute-binding subunit n=1 Tax=Mariprofundus sp. EBB-1 TaxID=2650971 RepID=UPI000EF22B51|nr:TAXI family TRAP transporter solute-binding subunit [Mariprofundus sp. EBB-1]RLL52694.1 TAXI family TRAP transporter solute-binding subunit [Mariprofundus sp. EBB-1]